MFRFISSLFFIIAAVLIQNTNLIIFEGIKPNMALVFIIVLGSLQKNLLQKSALIFAAAFLLKFYAGIETQNILFIITSFSSMLLVHYLPWKKNINILITILIAGIIMNVINFDVAIIIRESIYNLFIGAMLLSIIELMKIFMRPRKEEPFSHTIIHNT